MLRGLLSFLRYLVIFLAQKTIRGYTSPQFVPEDARLDFIVFA
jgi:hypothetical protein